MIKDLSKRLTLEELKDTEEYRQLTPKQQLWVATYCAGGLVDGHYDAVAATQTAYDCKNLNVARIMSYATARSIRVVAALNRHFNLDPTDEFLIALDRAVKNKYLTLQQLAALKLQCEVLGIKNRLPDRQPINTVSPETKKAQRKKRKARKEREKKKNPESLPAKPDFPSHWKL